MKTPLQSRGLATLLLLAVLSTGAFQANAQVVQINTGTANTPPLPPVFPAQQ
ncbi:MAG: hypothetical protein IPI95_17330 [Flavobacteriales bacterium]|nr:hypothetical protein [Flavobacteriales bacterium]MBK7288678.1 hypothetical protein [Flavobacteriales bacterium]